MTLTRLHDRVGWLLPIVATVFALLAVGAAADALPWDRPITEAAVDARTPDRNEFALDVSRLGSTPMVALVAALASLVAWPRCRPLAIAIIVLALARPLVEFVLKELIGRDRPTGDRLVAGRGKSFPSGHPFAAAASWGFVPLVFALYSRRRVLWWASVVVAWGVVLLVAASRVWLGVHWASDVVGGVLLAVLGVLGAERVIRATHRGEPCAPG
jgi:undecaprenyl-diphosphatase